MPFRADSRNASTAATANRIARYELPEFDAPDAETYQVDPRAFTVAQNRKPARLHWLAWDFDRMAAVFSRCAGLGIDPTAARAGVLAILETAFGRRLPRQGVLHDGFGPLGPAEVAAMAGVDESAVSAGWQLLAASRILKPCSAKNTNSPSTSTSNVTPELFPPLVKGGIVQGVLSQQATAAPPASGPDALVSVTVTAAGEPWGRVDIPEPTEPEPMPARRWEPEPPRQQVLPGLYAPAPAKSAPPRPPQSPAKAARIAQERRERAERDRKSAEQAERFLEAIRERKAAALAEQESLQPLRAAWAALPESERQRIAAYALPPGLDAAALPVFAESFLLAALRDEMASDREF